MKPDFAAESRFEFYVGACGPMYVTLLSIATVASIGLTLVLLKRGRWPEFVFALLMLIPLPLFVGIYGAVSALVQSLYAISLSDTVVPEYGRIISRALVRMWIGCWLSIPSFIITAVGLTRAAREIEA